MQTVKGSWFRTKSLTKIASTPKLRENTETNRSSNASFAGWVTRRSGQQYTRRLYNNTRSSLTRGSWLKRPLVMTVQIPSNVSKYKRLWHTKCTMFRIEYNRKHHTKHQRLWRRVPIRVQCDHNSVSVMKQKYALCFCSGQWKNETNPQLWIVKQAQKLSGCSRTNIPNLYSKKQLLRYPVAVQRKITGYSFTTQQSSYPVILG